MDISHFTALAVGITAGAIGMALMSRIMMSLVVDEIHRLQIRSFALQEEVNRLKSELNARSGANAAS